MDRSILYREIVALALDGDSIPRPVSLVPSKDNFTVEIDSIALQLAKITSTLKQLRPRYLAMSGPSKMSSNERDEFDYTVRQLLQREQRRVRALEQAEQRRQSAQENQGLASKWFANPETEQISRTLCEHRKGQFFYVNLQLQQASQVLADLQRVRLARSHKPVSAGTARRNGGPSPTPLVKSADLRARGSFNTPKADQSGSELAEDSQFSNSVLSSDSKTPGKRTDNPSNLTTVPEAFSADSDSQMITRDPSLAEPSASDPAYQLLVEEHDSLLEDLNATLTKAQHAEQSLREISELQSELSQHLATQSQQLTSLTSDAFKTTGDITAANKQLEKAKKSGRRASRIIIFSSLATGIFLLLLNGR